MNDNDVALFKRGLEILCRVFFAAGAKVILPGVHGFDEIRSEEDLSRFRRSKIHARDLMTSAYHPLGTARMGVDAKSGVIGPDHQHHAVPDLYVVDGSAMPTSLAVNPQITIMAMATRAAERLADRLS
jgi:choline dehydrogenase-like flavoprotein